MRKLIVAFLSFPLITVAQVPDLAEINDRLQTLSDQRNENADRIVLMAAEIGKLKRALEIANKKVIDNTCKSDEKK